MKIEAFSTMPKGTRLLLKPDRAVAYGQNVWEPVTFHHVQERSEYIRPYIVASYQGKEAYPKVGHFKPSDFKGEYWHEIHRKC